MADSPAVQAPLDPREQPILEKILLIRDHLFLLKQDKSTYVKSTDIIPIYDKVIDQVHLLNDVRVEKRLEQNRGPHHSFHYTTPGADYSRRFSGHSPG
jgi:hypothetical protein